MPAPTYTVAHFAAAIAALLPRGRAWPRDPAAVQTALVTAFAPSPKRVADDAAALLVDAFPGQCVDLLPEWEATLGLPDACAGPSPTLEQRQAQVLARFVGLGGNTASWYVEFAANLGYSITIRNHKPFRCGRSRCTDPLGGPGWMSTWTVVCADLDALLECELRSVNQAHTPVRFATS